MNKVLAIICVFCLSVCLSCSKDDKDDDYLRCSKCHKILTTEYDICISCKANICPSCIIVHPSYGGLGKIKECPVCHAQWNVRRRY